MIEAVESPYLAVPGAEFKLADMATQPVGHKDEKLWKKNLKTTRRQIAELQHQMYAEDRQSLLIIFQAMDAAGKDSTIRAVTKGINPAGCQVKSFKKPSALELDHDFLWRTNRALPERGRIGIFNRSYYEELLVVRVHPAILDSQRLPEQPADLEQLWQQRFAAINAMEKHLLQNGTMVIKFWLNISKQEQRQRFLSRLDEPHKHWKFSAGDVRERGYWDDYMHAYEQAIRHTSQSWAPWYAIPADNKPYMRVTVAEIILKTLQRMNPQFPQVAEEEAARFDEMRKLLENE